MSNLNITFEIVAAYKAYQAATTELENAEKFGEVASNGKVYTKHGTRAQKMKATKATKALHNAIREAGNTRDFDIERVMVNLAQQPSGIAAVI